MATSPQLRCLIVVPPLAGHVHPILGIERELRARGHQVAWAGSELVLRPILGPDAHILPTGSRLFREQGGSGDAALHSLWEGFVRPYTRFTIKALDRELTAYRPDLVLVDQHAPVGALVAHRRGVRWATLAPSSMELGRPLRERPELEAWLDDLLLDLWRKAALPEEEYIDPRFSPDLVLALTSRVLAGDGPWPEHYALVGPILAERPSPPEFPWELLDPARRHVLVTLGTLAADVAGDFYARAAEALAPLGDRVQGILAAPEEALAGLPELPPGLLVLPRVPVLQLLARGELDAVLSHGGMNTVCETLTHGLPLVIAPIRHDQPITADQVVAAGAGLRVDFTGATPEQLREALTSVLDEPGYREAAELVRNRFLAEGGARTAVDLLEQLAAGTP